MKRVLLPLIGLAVCAAPGRAQGIVVSVNGDLIPFAGQAPVQAPDGTILVPLRGIFEHLGAQVKFVAATRTITASRGKTAILLRIGEAVGYVNDNPRPLTVPAQTIGGTTLVPLRFVSEAFGATVKWDLASRTVRIVDLAAPRGRVAGVAPAAERAETPPPAKPIPGPIVGALTALDINARTLTLQPDAGAAETIALAPSATITVTVGGQPPERKDLSALRLGDLVAVKTRNASGAALAVEVSCEEKGGIVKAIDGAKVTLVDGSTVEIAPGAQIVRVDPVTKNASPATLADLHATDRIAFRINPARRHAVSVAAMISEPPPPPKVEITKVTHNAPARFLRPGEQVVFTVQGTAGAKALLKVPGLAGADAVPMSEVSPGHYTAAITVPEGVLLRDALPSATLTLESVESPAVASADGLSIDSVPPDTGTLAPADNAQVDARPQITGTYTDRGSGIDKSKVQLLLDGAEVGASVSEGFFSYKPGADLPTGRHTLSLVLRDLAGNQTRREWAFTVVEMPLLKSLRIQPTDKPLDYGDVLTFKVDGAPNAATATVTIGPKISVTLREDSPGVYVGSYALRRQDMVPNAVVTATLTFADGRSASQSGERPLTLTAGSPDAPVIDLPQEGARVGNSVILSGRALPNASIKVSIRYEGKRGGLIGERKLLEEVTVKADARGRWATDPIVLKVPRDMTGATFYADVVAVGTGGDPSAAVTVRFRK